MSWNCVSGSNPKTATLQQQRVVLCTHYTHGEILSMQSRESMARVCRCMCGRCMRRTRAVHGARRRADGVAWARKPEINKLHATFETEIELSSVVSTRQVWKSEAKKEYYFNVTFSGDSVGDKEGDYPFKRQEIRRKHLTWNFCRVNFVRFDVSPFLPVRLSFSTWYGMGSTCRTSRSVYTQHGAPNKLFTLMV